MEYLESYDRDQLLKLTSLRTGETKWGETLKCGLESIERDDWVILGIPEDIGVRANYGRSGASEAFVETLSALCNFQDHDQNANHGFVFLGQVMVDDLMEEGRQLNPQLDDQMESLRELTAKLDERVHPIIEMIVSKGGKPLVIGGGHNNAYGIIKGVSKALDKSIDVINIDAHADMRKLEGRHSGNGFSYAMEEGFLDNYKVIGYKNEYNNQKITERFHSEPALTYHSIKDLAENGFPELNPRSGFGLEIDLDVIADFPSSAMHPVGLCIGDIFKMIEILNRCKNASYVHICEGAPRFGYPGQVGKTIATIISKLG